MVFSPLKLSKVLNKELGVVLHTRTLNSGALMIVGKSVEQQNKVLKIKNILGNAV